MLKQLLPTAAISGLLLIGSLPANGAEPAVEFRESIMTLYKWYLQPMGGMVKGERPFDAAAFRKNAEDLANVASLDLTVGFPEGSDDDTEARPDIWLDWDGFTGKFADLQSASAELARVAAGGDIEAMKQQFKATAGTCGGCHKKYREKK
jgi:cytochrome c556